MKEVKKDEEIKQILACLSEKLEGMSAPELLDSLNDSLSARTLQRRLDELITQRHVKREGKGKQTRYLIIRAPKALDLEQVPDAELDLSEKAQKIQKALRRPLSEKKRVEYNPQFLESYEPNVTFYLTPEERDYLKDIGKQPDGNQPAGTFARKILGRFLIDLSWNSSRLEGNTYSLLETENLINRGELTQEKLPMETQMIINHKAAIEFLVESSYEVRFNMMTICNLHALLADNLLGDPSAEGQIRRIPVAIGRTAYQPLNIPQLVESYFRLMLDKAQAIENPFEQAFFIMVHLPYLQPFQDVNKRTSRLSMNIPFIKNNYCPISFVGLSKQLYVDGTLGVYELNEITLLKEIFIWAYERSTRRYASISHVIGEPDPFRMTYRAEIYELTKQVVSLALSQREAISAIKQYAEQYIQVEDQARFIEVVETELLALHEGNFVRYQITLSEFKRWHAKWL